jgi:hypothetical protein
VFLTREPNLTFNPVLKKQKTYLEPSGSFMRTSGSLKTKKSMELEVLLILKILKNWNFATLKIIITIQIRGPLIKNVFNKKTTIEVINKIKEPFYTCSN